jgi:hypothetical protein
MHARRCGCACASKEPYARDEEAARRSSPMRRGRVDTVTAQWYYVGGSFTVSFRVVVSCAYSRGVVRVCACGVVHVCRWGAPASKAAGCHPMALRAQHSLEALRAVQPHRHAYTRCTSRQLHAPTEEEIQDAKSCIAIDDGIYGGVKRRERYEVGTRVCE